jgi:hypothetical protein
MFAVQLDLAAAHRRADGRAWTLPCMRSSVTVTAVRSGLLSDNAAAMSSIMAGASSRTRRTEEYGDWKEKKGNERR